MGYFSGIVGFARLLGHGLINVWPFNREKYGTCRTGSERRAKCWWR